MYKRLNQNRGQLPIYAAVGRPHGVAPTNHQLRTYGHGPGAPGCPKNAKQTQFPQAKSQKPTAKKWETNPIPAGFGFHPDLCRCNYAKRTQFPPHRQAHDPNAQNKPNSTRPKAKKCETNPIPARPTTQICETNPIFIRPNKG